MKCRTNYIGVDVSKLSFDVAIASAKDYDHHQLPNNEDGFKSLRGAQQGIVRRATKQPHELLYYLLYIA